MSQKPLVSIMTASSNTGSACLHELYTKYSNNVRIRAVFRSQEKSTVFAKNYPEIEIVTGCDATKTETLSKAFYLSDYALIVTPMDRARGMKNDSDLTIAMINAAVQNNVKYIVIVTSFTVHYPEKMSLLASRDLPSENLLRKLGEEGKLKWTILRPGFFMDNILPAVQKSIESGVLKLPDYAAFYVSTKDIGKSAAACLASTDILQHNQKCYEIYGPEILTGEKMAKIVEKISSNKKIKFQPLSIEEIKAFMTKEAFQTFEYVINEKISLSHSDHVKLLTNEWTNFEDYLKENLKHD
ncbi:NAD(P)-dependent oxidoreductase [Brachionus plicatilis]|uniref:NAD(P)-dependent oxidoreductase n=1 Tax=Brachionus plicatilis TaxID=10195 RepID=A0A3M7QJV4_BRAPC|nr:NAD(P)-dependent oxidoreductase [Brachionus plicatilis]